MADFTQPFDEHRATHAGRLATARAEMHQAQFESEIWLAAAREIDEQLIPHARELRAELRTAAHSLSPLRREPARLRRRKMGLAALRGITWRDPRALGKRVEIVLLWLYLHRQIIATIVFMLLIAALLLSAGWLFIRYREQIVEFINTLLVVRQSSIDG